MCYECDREPDLKHEHDTTPGHQPDRRHDCEYGDACWQTGGMIGIVGWPDGSRVAHWKTRCGVTRHQNLGVTDG